MITGEITRDVQLDADSPFSEFYLVAVFHSSAPYIGKYVDDFHAAIEPRRLRASEKVFMHIGIWIIVRNCKLKRSTKRMRIELIKVSMT